ncbi:MAG: VWA domain-containing protein, partial [Gracilibacteraceae bacterium]|nr:VWA domain-containing protein [Gracilibacteraceae bacterium]
MLILLPQPSYAASLTPEETPEIIWAVDVSGSVRQTDAEGFWREAVLLGADILPLGAKMGFVAANTGVVAQVSPQPDMTHAQWKTALETVPINGDTDLSVAVKAALTLFDESAAKRIILVGDISEGGFFAPGIRPADKLAELDDLAQELKTRDVRLDCIFLGAGRAEQAALDTWRELAEKTGGVFTLLSKAEELTDAAAEAYFTVYPYARAVTGSLNTTAEWQTVQIALPDAPLEKARVFIPHAEV